MSDKNEVRYKGTIVENLPGILFRIESEGRVVLGYLSGKMRQNRIGVGIGDEVLFVMPPNAAQARIVRRV